MYSMQPITADGSESYLRAPDQYSHTRCLSWSYQSALWLAGIEADTLIPNNRIRRVVYSDRPAELSFLFFISCVHMLPK